MPKNAWIILDLIKYIITHKQGRTIHHTKIELFDKFKGKIKLKKLKLNHI